MTQQDLINLIGLKISDQKLINHFDGLGLKQPKSCTPLIAVWLCLTKPTTPLIGFGLK